MDKQNIISDMQKQLNAARLAITNTENRLLEMQSKKNDLIQERGIRKQAIENAAATKEKALVALVQDNGSQSAVDKANSDIEKEDRAFKDINDMIAVTEQIIRETESALPKLQEKCRTAEQQFFCDIFEKAKLELRELAGDKLKRIYVIAQYTHRRFSWLDGDFYTEIFGKYPPERVEFKKYIEDI